MKHTQRSWALFNKSTIYHPDGTKYMTRYRLLQTPWFGIRVHHIHSSDLARDFHDHPWSFVSLLLAGSYDEERPGAPPLRRRRWSLAFRGAEALHTVKLQRPCWTLVFTGKLRREWGFRTADGWLSHTEYVERLYGGEIPYA